DDQRADLLGSRRGFSRVPDEDFVHPIAGLRQPDAGEPGISHERESWEPVQCREERTPESLLEVLAQDEERRAGTLEWRGELEVGLVGACRDQVARDRPDAQEQLVLQEGRHVRGVGQRPHVTVEGDAIEELLSLEASSASSSAWAYAYSITSDQWATPDAALFQNVCGA